MEVTGDEGSLETAGTGVKDDTPGDQEGRKTVIDSGKGLNGGSATEQKHRGNDDVGAEGEEEEGQVGSLSPTSADDFANSVGRGSNLLEGDGEDAEEKDLDGGTGSIPVGGGRVVRNDGIQSHKMRGEGKKKAFLIETGEISRSEKLPNIK